MNETHGNWISVLDHMPEKPGLYLVYAATCPNPYFVRTLASKPGIPGPGRWRVMDNGYYFPITHWQEPPEPPESTEDLLQLAREHEEGPCGGPGYTERRKQLLEQAKNFPESVTHNEIVSEVVKQRFHELEDQLFLSARMQEEHDQSVERMREALRSYGLNL